MRLALVSLHREWERVPHLGLLGIGAMLKRELPRVETTIVDANFGDPLRRLKEIEADMVGISAMSVQYGRAAALAGELRAASGVPVFVGGVHISTLPESLDHSFSFGVIGDGEQPVTRCAELFLSKGRLDDADLAEVPGLVLKDPVEPVLTPRGERIEEIDTLPPPDFGLANPRYLEPRVVPWLSERRVLAQVVTSRGCPYRCRFCSTTRFWGKPRLHDPEYTARYVAELVRRFGVRAIDIWDDLFTLSKARVAAFVDAFRDEGVLGEVALSCLPRAELLDEEMCRLLRSLGVRMVNLGLESGSDRVLKMLKGPSASVETNRRAVLAAKRNGLKVYGSLMFGSPTETVEEMGQTLEFIDFLGRVGADHIFSFVATPFPGTPFWDEAVRRSAVGPGMDWALLSHHNWRRPLLADIPEAHFRRIFLEGRRKLRRFKLHILGAFLRRHPLSAARMLATQPRYYARSLWLAVMHR